MNPLKGKTVIILFDNDSNEIEERAIELYKYFKSVDVIAMFATSYYQLSVIKRHGYDLLYMFLDSDKPIPTKEEGQSMYHLHDVTQADHYWLYSKTNPQKAIDFFIQAELELNNRGNTL